MHSPVVDCGRDSLDVAYMFRAVGLELKQCHQIVTRHCDHSLFSKYIEYSDERDTLDVVAKKVVCQITEGPEASGARRVSGVSGPLYLYFCRKYTHFSEVVILLTSLI